MTLKCYLSRMVGGITLLIWAAFNWEIWLVLLASVLILITMIQAYERNY